MGVVMFLSAEGWWPLFLGSRLCTTGMQCQGSDGAGCFSNQNSLCKGFVGGLWVITMITVCICV